MSEIKKPVITKEQAEALIMLQADFTDSAILEFYVGDSLAVGTPRYSCLYDLDLLTFATVLINGYEVEKTTEEKVRELYDSFKCDSSMQQTEIYKRGEMAHRTIERTLDCLGKRIEGVNA